MSTYTGDLRYGIWLTVEEMRFIAGTLDDCTYGERKVQAERLRDLFNRVAAMIEGDPDLRKLMGFYAPPTEDGSPE